MPTTLKVEEENEEKQSLASQGPGKQSLASQGPGKKAVVSSKVKLAIDPEALKRFRLVVVAYSSVQREHFPTKSAYEAEIEVEERAIEVSEEIRKLGIPVRTLPGDQYFYTNLLVDKPDLIVNLVDTLRGKDQLCTSVPAALELASIPYTGTGMEGLVIGSNRNLTKKVLAAYDIPTPPFQFIRKAGTKVDEDLGFPLIVKLNESGGSVGIDNNAVKEDAKSANAKVTKMISTYKMPVVVEKFIDGPEVTVVVFDDGVKNHVFMAQKKFGFKPDGKHEFTSFESYDDWGSYKYKAVEENLKYRITKLAVRAFNGLYHKDYAKFDIRVDEVTGIPYFIDSNPNTAFGPVLGLPMTDVLKLNGISFSDCLASLLSKYAKDLP